MTKQDENEMINNFARGLQGLLGNTVEVSSISLQDLYGDNPPTADLVYALGETFTEEQRIMLADGLAQSEGERLLLNFVYGREDDERDPFRWLMCCGVVYRQMYGFDSDEESDEEDERVNLFLVLVDKLLEESMELYGFSPTEYPGIYKTDDLFLSDQTVIILPELRNTPNNALMKLFSRSPAARSDAYNVMVNENMGEPSILEVAAQVASLTEEEYDDPDANMMEVFFETLG